MKLLFDKDLFESDLYHEIEEISKVGVYETNVGEGVFRASSQFRRMFDLPEQETYPVQRFTNLLHPEDRERVMQFFNQCLEQHQPFDCEYRCLVEGKTIYVRSRSRIYYHKDGRPDKVLGIKQDITETKLAEQEKQAFTRELIRNREATAVIAHDLRSPISTIKSIYDLIREDVSGSHQRFVDQIPVLCERANEIIEDVLELNQLEQGDYALVTSQQPLAPLVKMAVDQIRPVADKKQLTVNYELQDVEARVHEQKIVRILNNLLSNAIKFSYENQNILIKLYERSDRANIEVIDHGIGMNPKQLSQLFEKFGNANRKGTKGEPTVGLGMNIVKRLVDLHQGEIRVESEKDKGTRVSISLPKNLGSPQE